MKLLRITAEGLPLFKEKLDLNFYAQQRVAEEHKNILYSLFSNIYLNSANGFIGINASGKTSVLKVTLLVLELLNNEPINHIETRDILGDSKEVKLNTYFFSRKTKEVCRLETIITAEKNKSEGIIYRIVSESLWTKSTDEVTTRKTMLDFEGRVPAIIRSSQEEFLSDDVSIMIARNKKTKEHIRIVNLLKFTNVNVLPFSEDIPAEVITFLDPTIESLHFDEKDKKQIIHLKFKGKEEIILNNPVELNNYLSSGTVKGMITFTLAQEVLKSGGYIVVDEVENHFNKEIVTTLMRFFIDSKLNKNGGTLIFSTHYPELLDEYDRNDSIFITRNRNGITVENLSNILKRNDIKKSDAYQSGFLEGTTPTYEAYLKSEKPTLQVTFDSVCAKDNRDATFLTQMHPLVIQAATFESNELPCEVGVSICSDELPAGDYEFLIYVWKYKGLRPDIRLVAVSDNEIVQKNILSYLQYSAEYEFEDDEHEEAWNQMDQLHYAKWQAAKAAYTTDVQNDCSYRFEQLGHSFNKREVILRDQIKMASDERIARMRQSQLDKLISEFEDQKKKLDATVTHVDIHTNLQVRGVLHVE